MHMVVYERDKLYEEVWAEPVIKVAERYGVSGVALAKTCRKLNVPLPPRGYWAKIKAGKTPRRAALPKLKKAELDQHVSYRYPRQEPPPRPPELAAAVPVPLADDIVVAEVLTDPHPLVERTKRHLEAAKPINQVLQWTNKPCLDINVSAGSLDRALRMADSLVKGIDGAGLQVEERITRLRGKRPPRTSIWETQQPAESEVRVTGVMCDDEWIEFSLSEKVKRVKDPKPDPPPRKLGWGGQYYDEYVPTTYSYEPTGELTLEITNVERMQVRTVWKDGKRQRLEIVLSDFARHLSTVALALKLQREAEERRRIAAIAEERRRRARQQHEWAEDQRRDELLKDLEKWRLARDIRAYVQDAVGAFSAVKDEAEMSLALRWRLAWALRYANSRDPHTPLREELQRFVAERADVGEDDAPSPPEPAEARHNADE